MRRGAAQKEFDEFKIWKNHHDAGIANELSPDVIARINLCPQWLHLSNIQENEQSGEIKISFLFGSCNKSGKWR